MPSLYRRILGEQFDQLPPSLREFHDIDTERRFTARFQIKRGNGWLTSLVCKIGGLPPSGDEVPVVLRVIPEGDRERWIRRFGDHVLESVQWTDGELMLENLGPVTMAFRLEVDEDTLRLRHVKTWLLNFLRWPRALGPSGEGVEVGKNNGVDIVAIAKAPLLGALIRYEGLVTPDTHLSNP